MKDEFIIKYDFTLAEYLSMNYQAMFRIKLTRGLLTFVTLVGIFGAVIQALLPGTGKGSLLSTYGRFLFLPVFLLLFLFIFIGLASLVLFKLKPHFFKGQQYIFNHWGMQKTGPDKDFSAQWSRFISYRESSGFIFLYLDEKNAYPVQKRMFSSEAELESFRQFIKEKLGK